MRGGVAAGVWYDGVHSLLAEVQKNCQCILAQKQDSWESLFAHQKFIVFASMGLHPYEIHKQWLLPDGQFNEEKIQHDEKMFFERVDQHRNKLFAIGETGFDLSRDVMSHPNCKKITKQDLISLQLRAFACCVAAAAKYQLPLIVHSRQAWQLTIQELERSLSILNVPRAMIHCFGGPKEDFPKLYKLNILASFGGVTTWQRAQKIREACQHCPPSLLLLETDSPDLPPDDVDGNRPEHNDVSRLPQIANSIAGYRNVPVSELAATCSQNLKSFLGF